MKQFLRETWELYYWSMCCPSKLQERMNEWAPWDEKDGKRPQTRFSDILLARANYRFVAQFFLLVSLFSLLLIFGVAAQGKPIHWSYVLIYIFTSYLIGIQFLPLGLQAPFLLILCYPNHSQDIPQSHTKIFHVIDLFRDNEFTLSANLLLLGSSLYIGYLLLHRKQFNLGRAILLTGPPLSLALGGGNNTQSWSLTVFFCIWMVIIFVIDDYDGTPMLEESPILPILFATYSLTIIVAGIAASTVAGTIVSIIVALLVITFTDILDRWTGIPTHPLYAIAGGIAIIIIGGIAGIIFGIIFSILAESLPELTTSLPKLSLAGWLIGNGLAPIRGKWRGRIIIVAIFFLTLPFQGLLSFVVALTTYIGYYRLWPNYLALALMSVWRVLVARFVTKIYPMLQSRIESAQFKDLLRKGAGAINLYSLISLPPYLDELLWFSLPGHDKILIEAHYYEPEASLYVFQDMKAAKLPGFKNTVDRALPQMVANQMKMVRTPENIYSTAQSTHPFLPHLIPEFYQDSGDDRLLSIGDDELSIILPNLQVIARSVGTSLEIASPYLRERSLENILNHLGRLQGQLAGLNIPASAVPRWRMVLECWQHILESDINRLRSESQSETINPFQSGNPLRPDRDHLFKGRQSFADAIVRLVLDRARPTLVLHGPRRFGKSSFLLNLPRLLPSDMLPVYVDLQSAAMTVSEGDFCYGLVRAMHRDARSQGLTLPTPQRRDFQASPYPALEDWLDQATPILDRRRLLLCLDEFEKLGTAIAQGAISVQLLDELRHLIQHRDELSFLFCGVQTLEELGPNWSSYFISVQPIEMLYLEPDEARAVLEDPDPRFDLRYDPGIVEAVLQETARQPYLLQLVGEQMVKQANQAHSRIVTPDLLDAALEDALTQGTPYFTNLWEEYSGTTPEERRAGQALLRAVAAGEPLPAMDEPTRAALRRLERYHVLQRHGDGYGFEIPLVARWVRERAV